MLKVWALLVTLWTPALLKVTSPLLWVKFVTSQSPPTVRLAGADKFARVATLPVTLSPSVVSAKAFKVPLPLRFPPTLWVASGRVIVPVFTNRLPSRVKLPVTVTVPAVLFVTLLKF